MLYDGDEIFVPLRENGIGRAGEKVSFQGGLGLVSDEGESDLEKGQMIIEVGDSPFAAAYGQAESGVCHLIRGVMAGLGAGIFGGEVSSVETTCAAKGDARCRFEVQKR